jgi:hypothetical protein
LIPTKEWTPTGWEGGKEGKKEGTKERKGDKKEFKHARSDFR